MQKNTDFQNWNEQTYKEQFLIRVKMHAIQHKIKELKNNASNDNIKPIDFIRDLETAIRSNLELIQQAEYDCAQPSELEPIAIQTTNSDFLKLIYGEDFDTERLFDMWLFLYPVKPVTHADMSQTHDIGNDFLSPFIKDNRLYVSIDMRVDDSILKTNFQTLLATYHELFQEYRNKRMEKEKVGDNRKRPTQITCTIAQITKHAFIQILDYRFKRQKIKDCQTSIFESEINLVKICIEHRHKATDTLSSNHRSAAINAIELLDTWLASPITLSKLKEITPRQ